MAPRNALVEAVKAGDAKKVGRLLSKGASPDTKHEDGSTVLMFAALDGHLGVARGHARLDQVPKERPRLDVRGPRPEKSLRV